MIALLDFARVLRHIFGEDTTRVVFFCFTVVSLVRALNEGDDESGLVSMRIHLLI